ncbi:MAG: pimeloyl-ACP methyl ester carboxylesterase [Neolewinella sp.]|jgi:pimeloyl-ACP methyl ester carboxylesterase
MHERTQNKDRWVNALNETSMPICHINGNYDPISGAHVAGHFRKTVPAAKVIDLEDIGHYPQIEAPEEVLRRFQLFIKSE